MSGGGRIQDKNIVAARCQKLHDPHQGHDLVQAGGGEVQHPFHHLAVEGDIKIFQRSLQKLLQLLVVLSL